MANEEQEWNRVVQETVEYANGIIKDPGQIGMGVHGVIIGKFMSLHEASHSEEKSAEEVKVFDVVKKKIEDLTKQRFLIFKIPHHSYTYYKNSNGILALREDENQQKPQLLLSDPMKGEYLCSQKCAGRYCDYIALIEKKRLPANMTLPSST